MRKIVMSVLLLAGIAFGQNPSVKLSGGVKIGGNSSVNGVDISPKSVNGVKKVDRYPGADFGEKLAACIADLPATIGGTCDARGSTGAQTISSTVPVTKPTEVLIGKATITMASATSFALTANLQIRGIDRDVSKIIGPPGSAMFTIVTGGSYVNITQFAIENLTLDGNNVADSSVITVPNFQNGVFNATASRWSVVNNRIKNFGTGVEAFNYGNSLYLNDFRRNIFMNNHGGDLYVGYASDGNVTDNEFWYAANTAPHIRIYGGGNYYIRGNEFEANNDSATGADIQVECGGYVWIVDNKFGGEGEKNNPTPVRNRVLLKSNADATCYIDSVKILNNSFLAYGTYAPQDFIKLVNPIQQLVIDYNKFDFPRYIVDDGNAPNTWSANSVLGASNTVRPPFFQSWQVFKNGGRGFTTNKFTNVGSGSTWDDAPQKVEFTSLSNIISQSEDFTQNSVWVKENGAAVECSKSDPWGTTRACLLSSVDGTNTLANMYAFLYTADAKRKYVRFWAKAGTLDYMIAGVVSNTTGAYSDVRNYYTLNSDWQEFRFSALVAHPDESYFLRFTAGSGLAAGNINICCVQVANDDSDYVPTSGSTYSSTTFGRRFARGVWFGGQTQFDDISIFKGSYVQFKPTSNGSVAIVNSSGAAPGYVEFRKSDNTRIGYFGGGATDFPIISENGAKVIVQADGAAEVGGSVVDIKTGGNYRWEFNALGHLVTFVDGGFNIGGASDGRPDYVFAKTAVVAPNLQGAKVTTGSIAGSSSAAVTLTWGTAFADASYSPSCSVIEAITSGATLRVHHIESILADSVTVRVVNDDSGAHTGILSCTGIR